MDATSRVAVGMVHGRFQPFHLGHLEYLVAAAARSERLVVGITNPEGFPSRPEPDDPARHLPESNPFTYAERRLMVEAAAGEAGVGPVEVIPFPITEPGPLGRPRPRRRGAVRARALALGLVEARPPARARLRDGGARRARGQARLGRAGPGAPSARAATGAPWSRRPSPRSSTPSPPTVRSIVVLLLDGLGDRASAAHGGRTANEAADTPNLDALAAAARAACSGRWGPGRAPSSEVGTGRCSATAPAESPGRAVIEALGHGHGGGRDDVLAFASLR